MAPIVAIIMQQSSSHYRHHHTALIIVTIICRGLSSSCQNHLQIIVQANTLYQILLHNSRGELVFSLLSKLYAVCCALPDCSIWVLPHIVVFPEHFVGCAFVLVYLSVVHCPIVTSGYCPILLHCRSTLPNCPRVKQGNQASASICTFYLQSLSSSVSSQLSLDACIWHI